MNRHFSCTILIICALLSTPLSADSLTSALTKFALENLQKNQRNTQTEDVAPPNYEQTNADTNTSIETNSYTKSYAHTKLKNFNLSGKNLSGTNFSFSRLENFNFSYADLSGANFAHATLINCDLRNANIDNVDFSYTKFKEQTKIAGLDFSTADMSYSKLEDADSTTQLEESRNPTTFNYEKSVTTNNREVISDQNTQFHQSTGLNNKLAKQCIEECKDIKRQDKRDCYEAYGAPKPFWKVERNPRINDGINACLSNVTNDYFSCKSTCRQTSNNNTNATIESYTPETHTVSQHTRSTNQSEKSYAHTTLSNMNFSNKDLQNTDFSYTTLNNVTFKNTNLTGANFKYSKLHNVNFQGANLQNTEFDYSHMYGSDLRASIVTNASFTYVEFKQGTKLAGVDFSTSDMKYAKMKDADFDTPLTISSKNIERVLTRKSTNQTADQKASINLAIQFDFNSSRVKQESMPQLKEVAMALQTQSLANSKIMVEGHTDAIGGNRYNQQLSEERASSVQYILTNNYGIDYGRVYVLGFGEKRPVASNDTDYGRAQNRRVTITKLNS